MSAYFVMCAELMQYAYAVAALLYLGLIGDAVILFSMSLVPGFV